MYNKLIEKIKKSGYDNYTQKLTEQVFTELQQEVVCGMDSFLRKLSQRTTNREEYRDILMEGRISIILAKKGFSKITFIRENRSHKLPDIKADYNGDTIYFEITRKRPNEDDERFQQLGAHWVSTFEPESIIGKIQEKLPQLKSGEINIVVLCSETVKLGRPDVEEAFKYIRQEIYNDPEKYKQLSAVILTESVVEFAKEPWGFNLFKNGSASKRLGTCLTKKLESLQS